MFLIGFFSVFYLLVDSKNDPADRIKSTVYYSYDLYENIFVF